MTIVLQPKTAVSIVGANTVVANASQKVLFVGQILAAGSATAGDLHENIGNDGAEDALFGANSMLAGMIRTARDQNEVTRFDAIGLGDNGNNFAAGEITVVGTATEAGIITFVVGSEKDYTFTVAVASADTATVVGDAIEAAITASLTVPVTAANTVGVVAVTANNSGTIGNSIGLSVSGVIAGLTLTVTAMTAGSQDPTFTDIFDVVGTTRYQGVVWPYFADTSEVRTFLEARFNVINRILDGTAFTASVDTLSNNLTRLNALNALTLVDFVDKTTSEAQFAGPAQLELLQVKSSQFAAIRALRLSDGESISQVVIATNGPRDAFGGPALAAKPYFNTPMKDLPLTATGRGWTDAEIEQIADAGGSVIGNNSAGNTVITGEIYTTYKTDVAGNPDTSFEFLNFVDTASGAREYFFNNLRARFAQSRLTTGDVVAGRDVANSLVISAEGTQLYGDLSGPDFVLLEDGPEALVFFKENLLVVIDKSVGRATITMKAPIVTQLREIIATMQIAFDSTS